MKGLDPGRADLTSNNTSIEDILRKLTSGDSNVRNSAIVAAGETGDPAFIEHLEKLCNVSDPATRYFAKKTIKKIKDGAQKELAQTAAAAEIEAAFDIDNFKIWLLNPNPERRLQALKNIYDNPPQIVLPVLSEKLKDEKDARVIATLVKLLGKIGGVDQINTIRKFLSHDDLRVRANAIEGLEFIGSEKVIPFIAPFLNDLDNRIKANAIKALAKFSSVETLSVVSAMMRSDHLWMRDSAIFALSHIATDEAVTMLQTLLNDAEKSISSRAMQALLKIGSPLALKFVDDFRAQSKETTKTSNVQMRSVMKETSHRPPAPETPKTQAAPHDQTAAEPLKAQLTSQVHDTSQVQAAPHAPSVTQSPRTRETPATSPAHEPLRTQAAIEKKSEPKKEVQPETKSLKHQARTPQIDLKLNAPQQDEEIKDFDKLKSTVQQKKHDDPITIFQDQDNMISSNFKGLDDDFYEYVAEIKFIALAQSSEPEHKKVINEKKEKSYDELASLPQQKSGGASDSKITAEMKKKIVMDQLRGLNKQMDGKSLSKK